MEDVKELAFRLFHVLFAFACLLVTVATAAATTFTMQRGVNLDPWVTWPPPERWNDEDILSNFPEWRHSASLEDLQAIRKAGFDFVRMPVDPAIFLEDASEARITKLIAGTLKAISMLHKAGLKVIVDLHSIPSDQRKIGTNQILADPALFARYLELVGRLGRTLSITDPALTAFEPFNEPVVDCDLAVYPKWPALLRQLHTAARKALPNHTLILTGGCWASAYGLIQINPTAVADDNVIWTFHSYEPYILTHQGAGWTGDAMAYVEGLPYPPGRLGEAPFDDVLKQARHRIETQAPEDKRLALLKNLDEMAGGVADDAKALARLNEPFDQADVWRRQYNIAPERIYLGEFGMIRQEFGKDFRMPPEWRAAYMKDVVSAAHKRGFPWSVWSWGGAFGITLADDKRVFDPVILDSLKTE